MLQAASERSFHTQQIKLTHDKCAERWDDEAKEECWQWSWKHTESVMIDQESWDKIIMKMITVDDMLRRKLWLPHSLVGKLTSFLLCQFMMMFQSLLCRVCDRIHRTRKTGSSFIVHRWQLWNFRSSPEKKLLPLTRKHSSCLFWVCSYISRRWSKCSWPAVLRDEVKNVKKLAKISENCRLIHQLLCSNWTRLTVFWFPLFIILRSTMELNVLGQQWKLIYFKFFFSVYFPRSCASNNMSAPICRLKTIEEEPNSLYYHEHELN